MIYCNRIFSSLTCRSPIDWSFGLRSQRLWELGSSDDTECRLHKLSLENWIQSNDMTTLSSTCASATPGNHHQIDRINLPTISRESELPTSQWMSKRERETRCVKYVCNVASALCCNCIKYKPITSWSWQYTVQSPPYRLFNSIEKEKRANAIP